MLQTWVQGLKLCPFSLFLSLSPVFLCACLSHSLPLKVGFLPVMNLVKPGKWGHSHIELQASRLPGLETAEETLSISGEKKIPGKYSHWLGWGHMSFLSCGQRGKGHETLGLA